MYTSYLLVDNVNGNKETFGVKVVESNNPADDPLYGHDYNIEFVGDFPTREEAYTAASNRM